MSLQIDVYGLNGQLVHNETIRPAKLDIQYYGFNFIHLLSGKYIMRISSDDGRLLATKKFIIN